MLRAQPSTNYLKLAAGVLSVRDVKGRLALAALMTASAMYPMMEIVIEGLDERRAFYLGHLLNISGWAWIVPAASLAGLMLTAFPHTARFVRPIDIVSGVVAPILGWSVYQGALQARASYERLDSIGMFDPSFAPVTSWSAGLLFGVAAIGMAVYRGVVATIRPLHA